MADRDEWEDPELEPDDEAAHEGANSDDDDISALLDELAGGDPPFENPAVAEGLASSGPPRWFGVRWREIAVEDRVDAWVGLRRWVDWLVAEFALPASVVPPCWFAHPQLVEELYAGMNMEYKAFEEQAPSMNPQMFWLPHLQQMTMRMRMMVENLHPFRSPSTNRPATVSLPHTTRGVNQVTPLHSGARNTLDMQVHVRVPDSHETIAGDASSTHVSVNMHDKFESRYAAEINGSSQHHHVVVIRNLVHLSNIRRRILPRRKS